VCVCVCDREKERERAGTVVSQQCPLKLPPSPPWQADPSTATRLAACLTQNEDYSERYG